MKYYAVIDTNVIVSATIKYNSVPGRIMELAFNGTIIPLLNFQIIAEYKEVLNRPKFHLTDKIITSIINEIEKNGIYVDSNKINIIFNDPKDVIFYEVVMGERKSNDAYLITGNIKHFPIEPYIVTPRQMLDIIEKN